MDVATIGYFKYVVGLFAATGLILVYYKTKFYRKAGLPKEEKYSRIFGWTNIGISVILQVATWMI